MLSAEDNVVLTRTGQGTPMGDVFRSYWMPALLSQELAEPDCAPVRVKLLGEDFVAFRDTQGRVGIVEPQCSHRGANLFFGRNEACGLRCAYHGWKYDVEGNCIDTPTVPGDVAERLRPKAAIRSAGKKSATCRAHLHRLGPNCTVAASWIRTDHYRFASGAM